MFIIVVIAISCPNYFLILLMSLKGPQGLTHTTLIIIIQPASVIISVLVFILPNMALELLKGNECITHSPRPINQRGAVTLAVGSL